MYGVRVSRNSTDGRRVIKVQSGASRAGLRPWTEAEAEAEAEREAETEAEAEAEAETEAETETEAEAEAEAEAALPAGLMTATPAEP